MDKDTVLLSLEKYDRLKDLERKVREDGSDLMWDAYGNLLDEYIRIEEAIGALISENKKLKKENRRESILRLLKFWKY